MIDDTKILFLAGFKLNFNGVIPNLKTNILNHLTAQQPAKITDF